MNSNGLIRFGCKVLCESCCGCDQALSFNRNANEPAEEIRIVSGAAALPPRFCLVSYAALLIFAHLARCAAAIFLRPAEIVRFGFGA